MLLRVKEESPAEIAGFVRAARATMRAASDFAQRVDVDWSSYAGKGRQLPWFILSALLLARNGWRVFMHGAEAHTEGRIYTGAALRALGFPVARAWKTRRRIGRANFAYLSIDALSPRSPTCSNCARSSACGRPFIRSRACSIPSPRPHAARRLPSGLHGASTATPALLLGQPRLAVFRGEGGEIERRPNKPCDVMIAIEGQRRRRALAADDRRAAPGAGRGDGPWRVSVALWRGEIDDEYGEAAIVGTLAIALKTLAPRTRGRAEHAGQDAVARARPGPPRGGGLTHGAVSSVRRAQVVRQDDDRHRARRGAGGREGDGPDLQEGTGLYRPDVAQARKRSSLLQFRLQRADAVRDRRDLRPRRARRRHRPYRGRQGAARRRRCRGVGFERSAGEAVARPSSLSSTCAAWPAASRRSFTGTPRSTLRRALPASSSTRSDRNVRRPSSGSALERYTDIPVIGSVGRDDGVFVRERHLGLTTPGESPAATRSSPRRAAASDAASISTGSGGSQRAPLASRPRSSSPRLSRGRT